MQILYKFLRSFLINNVEKINNIYKFYKDRTNINNLFKLTNNIFNLNKLKYNIYKNYVLETNVNKKNNISNIDKIFEGGNNNSINNDFCSNTSVVTNVKSNNNSYFVTTINRDRLNTLKYKLDVNFYNLSLILFPLTFNSSLDSANYVYNIYKYIYTKSFNSYKSCFISLFYYYFGLLISLICLYRHDNINVLDSNMVVIICKLSSFVKIVNYSYSNAFTGFIMSIKLINIVNNSLYLCNEKICLYRPYLIGITKYVLTDSGVFSKLSFQETLRFFKNIIFEHKTDWKVDSKSNIISSDFIPVGSGWYRYFFNK